MTSPTVFRSGQKVSAAQGNGINPLLPFAKAIRAATFSLPDNTNTPVDWDTIQDDTHLGFDLLNDASEYICPFDGRVKCYGLASWAGNTTGRRAAHLTLDGTDVAGSQEVRPTNAIGDTSFFFALSITVLEGQALELILWQNSGGSLNTATALKAVNMSIDYRRVS